MPRKTEAGRFGKRTTLPSGCMKNLTQSPGFNPRCSRIAFGIVAWPFLSHRHDADETRVHTGSVKTSRFKKQPHAGDHGHRTERDPGRQYRFNDAETLIDDFFNEVESVLRERGIGMTVVRVEDIRRRK